MQQPTTKKINKELKNKHIIDIIEKEGTDMLHKTLSYLYAFTRTSFDILTFPLIGLYHDMTKPEPLAKRVGNLLLWVIVLPLYPLYLIYDFSIIAQRFHRYAKKYQASTTQAPAAAEPASPVKTTPSDTGAPAEPISPAADPSAEPVILVGINYSEPHVNVTPLTIVASTQDGIFASTPSGIVVESTPSGIVESVPSVALAPSAAAANKQVTSNAPTSVAEAPSEAPTERASPVHSKKLSANS